MLVAEGGETEFRGGAFPNEVWERGHKDNPSESV